MNQSKVRKEKIEAQERYCVKNQVQLFMPDICFKCKKMVVDFYSLDECYETHITGCRSCNTSFVE